MWLLVAAAALLAALGCSPDPATRIPEPAGPAGSWLEVAGQDGRWNLLLVTLDTTRRDRLGFYGGSGGLTPHLDSLAASGILFERAISPVPITLPAHATLLTGLDPQEHGVRNNGTFVLDDARVSVAEVLHEAGYATGAIIGAFPLEARFGLDQGFETYDDDFAQASQMLEWELTARRADVVTDRAIAWLEMNAAGPFFLWAHYFDPHAPYDPPEPYRGRHPDPYDGEVAFMDAEVGRLLASLGRLGLCETTWVLAVADHGESLGEHGEATHSILIYGATQEVPCILVAPQTWRGLPPEKLRGVRREEVVGLRDLAPTLMNGLGLARTALPASGSSLLPLVSGRGTGPRVVYIESLAPSLEHGWSELRGVRTADWSYIRAPQVELYDLRRDPRELHNVCDREAKVRARLAAWLDHFAAQGEESVVSLRPDAETIARLRSLGYLAGHPSPSSAGVEKDPKNLIHVHQMIYNAYVLTDRKPLEAAALLDQALSVDPENPRAWQGMGTLYLKMGHWERAYEIFGQLMERTPDDAHLRVNRAWACLNLGRLEEAEALITERLEEVPDDHEARSAHAELLARRGRVDLAREILTAEIRTAPSAVPVLLRLGRLEWQAGRREEAARCAARVLELDDANAAALALAGEALWYRSEDARQAGEAATAAATLAEARAHLERAHALDQSESRAAFRLAFLAQQEGRNEEARARYTRLLAHRPQMAEAHANLGNLLRESGSLEDALRHYAVAESLGFETVATLVNHGVVLAIRGRPREARARFARALELTRDPRMRAAIRRNLEMLED